MDPLSHAALGRTLLACRNDGPHTRALVLTAGLGALSPDVDAVVMPFGWDLYLRVHEIGTHTIAGTLACALLTASIVRVFARAHTWRGLVGVAWIGAASHIALDLLSSARIRLLWPFVNRQVGVPLVAMADPWLAAILIVGAGALVFTRRHKKRAGRLVVACAVTFLLLKGVMATRALTAYAAAAGADDSAARIMEATWATLTEWRVFDRVGGEVRVWRANGALPAAELLLTWPIAPESPRIQASRELAAVRNFHHVHDLAFAATVKAAGGREWVLWSDIRYCWNPDARDARQVDPVVATAAARLSCGLWVGGEFDPRGRALQQVVKIGGFLQERAVGE